MKGVYKLTVSGIDGNGYQYISGMLEPERLDSNGFRVGKAFSVQIYHDKNESSLWTFQWVGGGRAMTTDEIVRALRELEAESQCLCTCDECYEDDCLTPLFRETADLIEQLTAGNADLRKEIEWKDMVIALAQKEQAKAEAERDAAIVDLKIFAGCAACKHCCNHRCYHQESLLLTCCDCTKKQNCKCVSCSLGRSNWEWRGLPEEPEEGGKA